MLYDKLKKSEIDIMLLLFLLSFVLRFFSFFPSVIDHDESTYLVVAKELLKGKVLYTDVTDIKPVGIFYITAGYLKLFGDSIFGYRIFGVFVIALTSFLLYRTKMRIGHPKSVALATGIIYVFFLSVWTYYGVAINTEHFYNLFTTLAIFILFAVKNNWRILLAGFIIGIGFLIKIAVAFDFAAILLFLFISDILDKRLTFKRLGVYCTAGLLFLVPFGLVNLAFYLTGHFNDFARMHYHTFFNYPQEKHYLRLTIWILDFFIRFLPITLFFFWSFFSRQKTNHIVIRERLFVSVWFVFCLISVLLPGKRFSHYLIQMMLPVSFLAANIFHPEFKKPGFIGYLFKKKIGYSLLTVLIVLNVWLQKKDYYDIIDCPRIVAGYIKDKMTKGDVIYTGNEQQIIYFLLNVSPPTKYIHRSLLFNKVHYNALGIDPNQEFQNILKKEPRFILERGGFVSTEISKALNNEYAFKKYFSDCEVKLYVRK